MVWTPPLPIGGMLQSLGVFVCEIVELTWYMLYVANAEHYKREEATILYITSDSCEIMAKWKIFFSELKRKKDSYIKSRFDTLFFIFNGNYNWYFFLFFFMIHNNVHTFNFGIIIIAIKCIIQKHSEEEASCPTCCWALSHDRKLAVQFFHGFIRTRISDEKIQFYRDVISIFSANCITRSFRFLCSL